MATRAVFSKTHDNPRVWILNLTPSEPKMNFPSPENMKASSVKLWTLLSITEQMHQHKINLVIYTLASINLKDLFLSKYGRVGSKVSFWKKMVFKSWSSDRKSHTVGGLPAGTRRNVLTVEAKGIAARVPRCRMATCFFKFPDNQIHDNQVICPSQFTKSWDPCAKSGSLTCFGHLNCRDFSSLIYKTRTASDNPLIICDSWINSLY